MNRANTDRMKFELATLNSWSSDPAKAALNLRNHRVSFDEATSVFGDLLGVTVSDPDHSTEEKRYITVGESNQRRLLIVAHSERGDRIRIISARRLTRDERIAYEETQQ